MVEPLFVVEVPPAHPLHGASVAQPWLRPCGQCLRLSSVAVVVVVVAMAVVVIAVAVAVTGSIAEQIYCTTHPIICGVGWGGGVLTFQKGELCVLPVRAKGQSIHVRTMITSVSPVREHPCPHHWTHC